MPKQPPSESNVTRLSRSDGPRVWFDIDQAEEYTHLDRESLYRKARSGEIKATKTTPSPKGRWLFHRDWLDEYLQANRATVAKAVRARRRSA